MFYLRAIVAGCDERMVIFSFIDILIPVSKSRGKKTEVITGALQEPPNQGINTSVLMKGLELNKMMTRKKRIGWIWMYI